jgi:hypothetical protein
MSVGNYVIKVALGAVVSSTIRESVRIYLRKGIRYLDKRLQRKNELHDKENIFN